MAKEQFESDLISTQRLLRKVRIETFATMHTEILMKTIRSSSTPDTQLLITESKRLITHDFRVLFMGHVRAEM